MTAMIVKHGDMGTTEGAHEAGTEQLTEDMAQVFSRGYLVDPMQVQRITLWKGCWRVSRRNTKSRSKGRGEGEREDAPDDDRACPLTYPTRMVIGA